MNSVIENRDIYADVSGMYMHDVWITFYPKPCTSYLLTYANIASGDIARHYVAIITAPNSSTNAGMITTLSGDLDNSNLELNWNNGYSLGIHSKANSWGYLTITKLNNLMHW